MKPTFYDPTVENFVGFNEAAYRLKTPPRRLRNLIQRRPRHFPAPYKFEDESSPWKFKVQEIIQWIGDLNK